MARDDNLLMQPSQNGSRGILFRISEYSSLATVAWVLAGLLLGYAYTCYPWKLQVIVVGAVCFVTITWLKPEYSLYLLFIALIMTTDSIPDDAVGAAEHFVIEEIKVPGLPSALNVVLIVIFSILFLKLYLFDKKTSVIPIKYLFIYVVILLIALNTGAKHPKATTDLLRLEFMKMLFPVLCFYASVNILNDHDKIKRMMWILFMICVVKSTILDAYYLAGRGFPFGDYRIVSYDTGELMAFIVMCLYAIMMIWHQRVTGIRAWLFALASTPLWFAILFSFRRGHWVGMLSSMGLLYLWSPREQRAGLRPFIVTGMVLAIPAICLVIFVRASLPAQEDGTLSRISSRFSTLFDPKQESNRHHLYESIQVMKDIMESPFFGLGLASEHSPVDSELGGWVEDRQPLHIVHNTFVYVWMKMGLLGFIFYIVCGYKYVREVVRYQKRYRFSPNWPLAMSIGSALGIWFVMFMTGPVPFYFHQTYLIAVFSAMLISLIRLEKMGKPYNEQ